MRRTLLMGIMLLAALNAREARAAIEAQTLMKGQSTTLGVEYEIGDAAVADPGVCDFLVGQDRRSLYLNGRGGGETSVTLWDAAGARRDEFAVRVMTSTLKEALERAAGALGEIPGVTLEAREGKVVISGEVAEPEDFRSIEAISRSDSRVRSRVRLAGEVIAKVAEAVREAVEVPGITVRAVRDRVVLEGTAYSEADARRAVEIARLYAPEVLDLIEVRPSGRSVGRGRLVELEFHLLEVKRTALRELGLNWAPGSFPGKGGGNAAVGGGGLLSAAGDFGKSVLGFVLGFIPRLKLIRERGDGRVLENPKVIVKSGEEARLFSGSEVPYLNGEEVQFKKVGVDLTATPIETAAGIDLKVSATLSAPSSDIRGAVDTHTVSTSAICPAGQSMVLGGIAQDGDVKMRNRAPRDLDTSSAIMTLFLSKDFQSHRSEFVIVVTPRIVVQPPPAVAELSAFLAARDAVTADRSKQELKVREASSAADDGTKPRPARRTGRRWR